MSLNPFSDNLAWLWDIIALVISFFCVMMVVQINGKIQKSEKLPTYMTRKIVHILAAPVYVLTWLLFSGSVFSRYIASIVPILFIVQFTLIGTGKMEDEAFIRSMSRSGDPKELLKGTLYYAIILFVVTILWFTNGIKNANPGALIILGCLAGGDGFADIIGRKYGGDKKFGLFGAEKTIAGTIAMFLGSFIFSYGLLAIFSIGIPDFGLVQFLLPTVIISFVVTIVEALPPPNSDNLTISISVVILIIVFALWIPSLWPFPIISL